MIEKNHQYSAGAGPIVPRFPAVLSSVYKHILHQHATACSRSCHSSLQVRIVSDLWNGNTVKDTTT